MRDLYGLMIFIGLCVCTLADVALDVRFEWAARCFSRGIAVYVPRSASTGVLSWWCLTVFVIALAGLVVLCAALPPALSQAASAGGRYDLCRRAGRAAGLSLPLPLLAPSARSTLAALGAVTFVVSDMTLCHNLLLKRPSSCHFVSLGIYYMAQLLLA